MSSGAPTGKLWGIRDPGLGGSDHDRATWDQFGFSVALDGDSLAIGALGLNEGSLFRYAYDPAGVVFAPRGVFRSSDRRRRATTSGRRSLSVGVPP
jgi:hypothetical protein